MPPSAPLPASAWSALAVALAPPRRVPAAGAQIALVVGVVVLCGLVVRGGAREQRALQASYASQDLLAVAIETDLFSGSTLWLGGLETASDGIEARLEAAGSDSGMRDSIDCGRLGDHLEPDEIDDALPAGVAAEVSTPSPIGPRIPGGDTFHGWVDGADPECVVLVAADGTVVGAAGHGSSRSGATARATPPIRREGCGSGASPPTTDDATVCIRLEGSDHFVALP